ncbi:MAG: choice-of-anchor L domain-containing protein [Oceanihabitans sp.]
MKKLFLFVMIWYTGQSFAQNIYVDSQAYTPQQLIEDVLIDSDCMSNIVVTNVIGGNFGSAEQSYGYFDATGTSFPIQSGIVLGTGRLANVPGPNDNLSDDTASGWIGDSDLEYVLGENNTHNATIIEFEFESIADQISFRYLFASEEYQEYDESTCQYSDLFGFLIKKQIEPNSAYQNIALVPGTNTPVKVTTVHPDIPGECGPINEAYFGQWNDATAPINFNGQTKVLTATAQVVPNERYHVKLVIADEYNYRYDSAVFLEAGSFNLTTDLGTDFLLATNNPLCNNDTVILDATNNVATNYKWFKDGIEITGENNATYTVNSPGVYTVEVTVSSTCISYGEITIEYQQTPVDTLTNVNTCDSYTLPTINNGNYFTASGGTGFMHTAGDTITTTQTLYIYNGFGNCSEESSFEITITNSPIADVLSNVNECDSYTLPNLNVGNYYTASGGNGTQLNAGDNITSTQTIYIYAESTANASCFNESSFVVTINGTGTVDTINNQSVCDSFILPAISNGNYYTASNGGGTALFAGDNITNTQTIYIYHQNGNCSAESSFTITIIETPTVDTLNNVNTCNSYTLSALSAGNYYTASGGNGTLLNAGDTITTTQTIYIYAETGTSPNCSNETSFTVTINLNPLVDTLNNVTLCDSYTLPTLVNGDFYTAPSGGGTQLFAGDSINNSQTIYIYTEIGDCSAESNFMVTIIDAPTVDTLNNINTCNSYTLSALSAGNYYTASGGNGTLLNAGDTITTTQTIYIYAETGTSPNCSNETSFTVTINPNPLVDTLNNVTLCDSYSLPSLVNGDFYTAPSGGGTQLFAGDSINNSQTIYIYSEIGDCSAESNFMVTINNTPTVDVLNNVDICDSYTLPALNVGNYFTQLNGNGTQLFPGDSITSSQTIYVYEETATTPNCFDQSSFQVNILTGVIVDNLNNVTACDSYTLQPITNGNYFTSTNGNGTPLFAGDVLTNTQTVYIFNQSASCIAESNFTITINNSPIVDILPNVSDCENFTLQPLNVGNYFTETGGNGTQLQAGDIITTTQLVYIYAETNTVPNCFDESSFTITINPTPQVDILNNQSTCNYFNLQPLTNGNYFTETGGTGMPLFAGDTIYTSQTIYIYNSSANCDNESSFEITIFPATNFSLTQDNIQITEQDLLVLMDDMSINYQYAIDNQNYQNSNLFYNLTEGLHILHVQDENGCVQQNITFTIEVDKFIIPAFFTPNADNYNDTWQVIDSKNRIKSIYIFDRYGKVITQVAPNSYGWDGNYNGKVAPSTDYWYSITLLDGTLHQGHFTLKR